MILSILVIVVCAPISIFWFVMIWRSVRAKYFWSSTKGEIENIYVEREYEDKDTYLYHPYVEYSYSVDGKQYLSTRIMYRDDSGYSLEELKELQLFNLANGSPIQLYYNPKNEAESVLAAKITPHIWLAFITLIMSIAAVQYLVESQNNL